MGNEFDKGFWEDHWQQREGREGADTLPANPHLVREVGDLRPGTALDAGCGEGAEAIWLASQGWRVTAADISSSALATAADRAVAAGVDARVRWVEADLSTWEPDTALDLVTTHYAHPAMPQFDFYQRLAQWVAPGGTLLVVGHLHTHGGTGQAHHPPAAASVTAAAITARLDATEWDVVTAEEHTRHPRDHVDHGTPLHDVVVRATRRARES